MARPANDLPPREKHNKREERWMEEWVNARLEEYESTEFSWQIKQHEASVATGHTKAWLEADGPELFAAEYGNIEPLRKKHPRLAKYLNLPKLEHGKRFPKYKLHDTALLLAVQDIARIRAIWNQYYKRRPKGYDPLEIAARRNWPDQDERFYEEDAGFRKFKKRIRSALKNKAARLPKDEFLLTAK